MSERLVTDEEAENLKATLASVREALSTPHTESIVDDLVYTREVLMGALEQAGHSYVCAPGCVKCEARAALLAELHGSPA